MHRRAAADLDYRLQHAISRSPGLVKPVETVKRALARGDYDDARVALNELEDAMRAANQPTNVLTDVRDALSTDAYWRQRAWKKVLVIFAGPGTNALFTLIIFFALFTIAGGKPTRHIDEVLANSPAAQMGLRPGDRIIAIDGQPIEPQNVPKAVSRSHGRPVILPVGRDGRPVLLGPQRPRKMDGAFRLGFVLHRRGLEPPDAAWHATKL